MLTEEKIKDEVQKSIAVLKNGGVLLYPTDTIWGIGCDALQAEAIDKVMEIKNRPDHKSFIILVHEENLLMKYVKEVPETAWDLISYSERPLTIIYPGAINLPAKIISADGSIAIRVVKHGFAHELLRRYNRPLVSTSANMSNEPTPLHFNEISSQILGAVDYVVDLPAAPGGPASPSVIMKLETNGRFSFIRR